MKSAGEAQLRHAWPPAQVDLTRSGKGKRLARMWLQAVHDMPIPPEPLSEDAIAGAPDVDVAVVAARHDKPVSLPQKRDTLDSLAVTVACIAMTTYSLCLLALCLL